MKKRRIAIVGGLAAGPSAGSKAVRTNPNAEVILFEAGETVSYGICEAPHAVSGLIEDEGKLVVFTPERLQEEKGFTVKVLHRVEKIIPADHKITVRDIRNHLIVDYEYDKLILATGAVARRLGVIGEDGRNVFPLRSREDVLGILNYMKSESPQSAAIIGGGYIGMEMAEAFRMRKMDVTMIHQFDLPMEGLELETRERVLEELRKNNVHFVPEARVEALQQDSSVKVRYAITDRGSFEAGIIVLSLGVEPNVGLAKFAAIRIGRTGAIVTDERQQTDIDDIYAAGDCCEVKNIVSGKPMYLPLASVASRTAWVAGENAAGGRATFKGAIRAVAVKMFGLEVAQVGLSSREAKEAGFQVVTESTTAHGKIAIMPRSEKMTIVLILDQRSKRLLGANLYGGEGTVSRANVLGVAIQQKLTADDIARLDLIYAPPFAPLWDPILTAANQAKKKLMP